MNELLKYWAEKDTKQHLFYLISGHFKTELIHKKFKQKEADKRLCIYWKVRGML